jgi:hypothetical protein
MPMQMLYVALPAKLTYSYCKIFKIGFFIDHFKKTAGIVILLKQLSELCLSLLLWGTKP